MVFRCADVVMNNLFLLENLRDYFGIPGFIMKATEIDTPDFLQSFYFAKFLFCL